MKFRRCGREIQSLIPITYMMSQLKSHNFTRNIIPSTIQFFADAYNLDKRSTKIIAKKGEGSEYDIYLQRHWSQNSDEEVWMYEIVDGRHVWPWPNMSTVHYFIHPYFLIGILRPVALKINIIFRPFSFFGNYLCRPLI